MDNTNQNKLPIEADELPTRVEPDKPEVLIGGQDTALEQPDPTLIPPASALPSTDPPTTTTMEVHHHAHAPHSKNKWKEYLFQFFMLFLAVFCGFLAEYQLEHVIEHQREKQFMESMVEDLKSDRTLLHENVNLRKQRNILIDSFILLLSDANFVKYGNEIYYIGRLITFPMLFTPNDRTIQQLISSGGLRLIRNLKVSDSIMSYYQKMQALQFAAEDEQIVRGEFRIYAGNVFDGRVFYAMHDKSLGLTIYRPSGNPQLLKKDAASINELIVRAQYLSSVQRSIRNREEIIGKIATNLMTFIVKEYHLKDR